jgi:hypothetical protein
MSNKTLSELEKLADPECEFCNGDGWVWDSIGDNRMEQPCLCTKESEDEADMSGADGMND